MSINDIIESIRECEVCGDRESTRPPVPARVCQCGHDASRRRCITCIDAPQCEACGDDMPTRTPIRTDDGVTVHAGDHVYNYYDCTPGIIEEEPTDGWFKFRSYTGKTSILDGSRICTFAAARRYKYQRVVEFHPPNGLCGKTQLPLVTDAQLETLAGFFDFRKGAVEIIDHTPDFTVDQITCIQWLPSDDNRACCVQPDGEHESWEVLA